MKIIGVNQEVRAKYDKDLKEKEKANSKEIECPTCGTIIRYNTLYDVKEEYERVNTEEDKTLYYYIDCPHCKNRIITKDYR